MDGLNLDGKVAVVTGGASGIGKAIAKCFAAHGATLQVLDIDAHSAELTAQEIALDGGTAAFYACDVTDPQSVRQVFSDIALKGRIDLLVNSAGVAHIGTLETTTPNDFDRLYRVNVRGPYLCMQAAVGAMLGHSGGTILNIASIAATAGIPDRFAYSMTKGALLSMTLSVAKDYLDKQIRCNCISPARVHTPFVDGYLHQNYPGREKEFFDILSRTQPIGRMARPDEVALLALYLCSDHASFLTGADIPFDGGFLTLRG